MRLHILEVAREADDVAVLSLMEGFAMENGGASQHGAVGVQGIAGAGGSGGGFGEGQPDRARIDGKAVYIFGTGADRMRKTEGKLVLCGQSGEIKIEVPNSDPLTASEFAQLARHRWKRPRSSIKLAHSDQSLEEFEFAMNAMPPGTCRRYPYERDTEEQQRAEIADTAHMRRLKKAHERSVRRSMKRKAANEPEHVGVLGQAEMPELRAGTWAPSADAAAAELGEVEFNRRVDRLHRTWKKNSSMLYDLVMIQILECPSLTVQWLPDLRAVPGYPAFAEHRFLIGTYSSAMPQEIQKPEKSEKRGRKAAPKPVHRDYLMVAAVQLPRTLPSTREDMHPEDRLEDNVRYKQSQVDVIARYGHNGEVNRARYMPQNPRIVATKSGGDGGELYLFDFAALGDKLLTNKDQYSADHFLTLRGHTKEGYGLCWNELKAGYLLSGAYDHRVCVWDVMAEAGKSRGGTKHLDPLHTFTGHSDCVSDVAWSAHNESVLFSVGDDKMLFMWDLRAAKKATASHVISDWAVNSIDCNRFSQHLLATGSGSKGRGVVRVWDDRKMDAPLNELTLHSDVVDVVSWSTHTEHVLASGSRDRKVQLVDIQKALPYSPSAAAMGDHDAREVMFVHAGHRHNVSDIAWNHECPWLVSSVSDAEENIQFWQPTQTIWARHTADAQDARSETSMDSDDDAAESSADARAAPQQQGAQAAPRDVQALLPARALSQIGGPGPAGAVQAAKFSGKGAARHQDGAAEKQVGNRSDNGGRASERGASADAAAVNTPELVLEGAQDGGACEGAGGHGEGEPEALVAEEDAEAEAKDDLDAEEDGDEDGHETKEEGDDREEKGEKGGEEAFGEALGEMQEEDRDVEEDAGGGQDGQEDSETGRGEDEARSREAGHGDDVEGGDEAGGDEMQIDETFRVHKQPCPRSSGE